MQDPPTIVADDKEAGSPKVIVGTVKESMAAIASR